MGDDAGIAAHKEWIGYVQPKGLVVAPHALVRAQAEIDRNIIPEQRVFLSCLHSNGTPDKLERIRDFEEFATKVLGWRSKELCKLPVGELSDEFQSLEVVLPEYHESLRPTYGLRKIRCEQNESPWLLLVQVLADDTDFDAAATTRDHGWSASPRAKFERLLRETQIPIGLLVNDYQVSLVYAPRGETSGYMDFPVGDMATVAGRPIFAALHMLLCKERLFIEATENQLPAILENSRKYQNTVSTELSVQVLDALYELLRGFQFANDQQNGNLLRRALSEDKNHVYGGILTVLMRLVFMLFTDDMDILTDNPTYRNYYSVSRLFERLREDQRLYPDTMDSRFGAWAQLLTLFRLVHDGASHPGMRIFPRKGYLFDPDRYPFLEGRDRRNDNGTEQIPQISDGVIFRVLQKLLILNGEKISYRTLDVEAIGSVYQAIMGFNLDVASGPSIAIKPKKKYGAPSTIDLNILLNTKPKSRKKWFRDNTDQDLTDKMAKEVRNASSIDSLVSALESKVARSVTPNIVPLGAMVLHPSHERRKSGSHYTPRSLTEPIVRVTLRPVIESLGKMPTPQQILDLKVCDPAMGSAAFLVEATRQLADELIKGWYSHACLPGIPADEDEVLYARRLIAQRCIYGVDRNPMAVDLAKLSLWLATLASSP